MTTKPQFAIVFDTNAYREFTFGKRTEGILPAVSNLLKKESASGAQAFANPFVMLELAAHLSDPNDPAYDNWKSSIVALSSHCSRQLDNGSQIAVLADSESQLCKVFHNAVPPAHANTTEKLCKIFKYIATDFSEAAVDKIRNDFKEISEVVTTTETRFVSDMMQYTIQGFDPSAIDWSSLKANQSLRKKLLGFLGSAHSLELLARIHIIKTYTLLNKPINGDQINDMAKFFLERFQTPLQLYNEIVRRIVMSGCDLTKKNRSNWIWDIQIAFNIGHLHNVNGHNVRLVTSDGDILKAAKEANCGSIIYSLSDYLDAIEKYKLK
jgi:hypothetical protein